MKCSAPGCEKAAVHNHHWVPKQRIKSRHKTLTTAHLHGGPEVWSLSEALADPRNLSPLCFACHGRFEQKILRLAPPASAWDFARQFGLVWSLEVDAERAAQDVRARA